LKILAILGSPHRGNTFRITQNIERKMKELGDVEFEYIHLIDYPLNPCRGCFACFINGEDKCPEKDGRDELIRKLYESDGVVFVSPTYAMTVSWLFKIFIDRFAYNLHRPCFFGKYAVVVSAAGNPGLDDTLKYMAGIASGIGFDVVDKLGLNALPDNFSLKPLMYRKDRTDEVAGNLFRAITEKRPKKLGMYDYLHFLSMREIYRTIGDDSPTDNAYFESKGWYEKGRSYFHDNVRGNAIAKLGAVIMTKMMVRELKKKQAGSKK